MTFRFELAGDTLIIDGLTNESGSRLTLDGKPVALDSLTWKTKRAYLKLPLAFFDARTHRVTVSRQGASETFRHTSVYDGDLTASEARIQGWVRDTTRPGHAIELDIDLDGHSFATVMADGAAPKDDIAEACGFDVALPDPSTKLLAVRVRGTDHYPLGKHLIRLSALTAGEALDRALPASETRRALDACNRAFLLNTARGGEPAAFPRTWRVSHPGHGDIISFGVDVIVPVYKGKAETLACLDSILNARVHTLYNLIVINDASPEAELTKALQAHAKRHDYILLENAENLGFVATVNRGMQQSPDNDVVLVNSDTVVGDFWLDRLKAAAYSGPDIASATPLSNNATILSLPALEGCDGLPYGQDLRGVNDLCARENAGVRVDIPTAHGFCMFIRRAVLREIGLFDAETFGKGYGEENDFSFRSAARGWRHVAACDVFVQHKGGVSFAETKDAQVEAAQATLARLYPDYMGRVHHFLEADPMSAVRNRLQRALWRDRPCAVFISLATGGGVDTNIEFLAKKLTAEGVRVLIARRTTHDFCAYSLTEWGTDTACHYPKTGGLNALCADLVALNPRFIHVHHLIDLEDGLDRFLVASGIPYYVTLHDYFYLCPRVTLLDDGGEYSGAPDETACNTCLKRGGGHRDLHPSFAGVWPDIVRWRDKWHDLLKSAAGLIAPSQAAADIYSRTFAGLTLTVRPHLGPAAPSVAHQAVEAPKKIRIALLGGVGAHKGYNEIIALLRWAEKREPDLTFVLIGYSDHIDLIRSFPNLEDHGPYTAETFEAKVRAADAHVALFLSPWPETYVYTLTEALTHGLTPVAYDLGAPGERLKALGVGELVKPGVVHADLVAAIRRAATVKITPKTYSEGDYGSLLHDYYGIDRIQDDRRNPSLMLPQMEGLFPDGWARRDIRLWFAARDEINRLKIDLLVPEHFGLQQARVRINDEDYGLIDIAGATAARRLDLATPPLSGLIRVEIAFSFLHRLTAPDERMAAARLGAVNFEYSEAPVAPRPSPVAIRLRQSPDMTLANLGDIDDSGRLETMYRNVAHYALFKQTTSLLAAPAQLAKDVMWSARIARRQGAKSAVKSFLAMRTLRKQGFDDAFYRMQLAGTDRDRMDPVNHYVVFGAREGLDPAPGFSTDFYLKAHKDLAVAGINPFYHFLRHGTREKRRIEPSPWVGTFLHGNIAQDGAGGPLSLPGALLSSPDDARQAVDSDWPKRDRPAEAANFTLHDRRPDDDMLDVAYMGKTFFEDFGLLGASPRWSAAVEAINALPRPAISDTPEVSVIIPVYGQLAYTLNCLHSLMRHEAAHRFEILIGDDASPDDSDMWLSQIDGLRYIRHDTNSGFIANCNTTATQARGKYLVFLNNDTRIADGWLDRLVETFGHFPKAGMVGSKLFYPDGSLQEAGGIVWRDGSAWNYGRDDDPNRPAYCYARQVDYVSGASLMIRTELWQQLNGFDTHYAQAYYEDTDLAFRVRAAGFQVVMQPLSKLVHYEGKTSGTDTAWGAKAYQEVNHTKFLERWRNTLASHRENGDKPALERDRTVTKRVLIIDATAPTPDQDAGSKATVDLIRYYQQLGYHVAFVPEDNFLYQHRQTGALQAMGVECFYAPFDLSMTDLLRRQGALYDVVQVIRAEVGFRNLDMIRRHAPQAKVLYLNADLHFLRLQRQALVEDNPALLIEADAMKAKELKLAAQVDATLVHSEIERDILNEEVPDARVAVLPLIEAVVESAVPYNARQDVMFLGGYNHPPNVDAANFLLDEIWPQLSRDLPDAKLLLVGSNPPPELVARASERVIVTGRVDDLAPWFDRSRLFIAALRYGAGIKGKVLAAMAHGVPVTATDIAAEGLEVENDHTVFLANTPEDIVAEARSLYGRDPQEWNRYSAAARDYIRRHHSFEAAHDVLRRVLED